MAKITKPLTNTEIERAKPKAKEYSLADGQGLHLRVLPNGRKSWLFNYVKPFTKKRTNFSMGSFPDVSLAQVRAMRADYLALLAQGVDPQLRHQQYALEQAAQLENTFLNLAGRWREKKAQEVEPLTLEKNWRRLELYLFPALANVAVSDIQPQTLIQALEPLAKRGAGDTLKRVIRLSNEILNFAVNYGAIPFNPCLQVKFVFTFGQAEHNPTIRPEALPQLLSAINHSRMLLFTKYLILSQLLTLTRPSEASGAEWTEIDLKAALWTIPAEKMKMRAAHVVPLSTQAIFILEAMREYNGNSRYVFESPRKAGAPMNSQSVNKALVDLGYRGKLTAHALRSIGSTYLNE